MRRALRLSPAPEASFLPQHLFLLLSSPYGLSYTRSHWREKRLILAVQSTRVMLPNPSRFEVGRLILHSLIASHYLVQGVNVQLREERGGWHSRVLTCWVITQARGRNYLKQLQSDAEREMRNERERARRKYPHPDAGVGTAEWDWFHLLLTLVPPQGQLLRPPQGQAEQSGGILTERRAPVLGTAASSTQSNSLHPQSQGGKAGQCSQPRL